jgi:hypothetical protein
VIQLSHSQSHSKGKRSKRYPGIDFENSKESQWQNIDLTPLAIDDRVDFGPVGTKNHRRAAVEVHRPDSVASAAQNVTKKSSELTRGRAVRAAIGSSPQKLVGSYTRATDDRVDFSQKRMKNERRAAAEVHQPNSVASAAQNVTEKSNEPSKGRAVRAAKGSSPQKRGG